MSQNDNLVSEISQTNAQFRTLLAGYWKVGIRPVIVNMGTFSDGTRYSVVDQYRDTKFYLVTDLLRSPFIFRVGTVAITINAGIVNAVGVVTLSPALDDVTKYKAFASVNDLASAWSGRARIASTTSLQVLVTRALGSTTTSSVGGGPTDNASTPDYPSDTQVDPGTGHTHALNAAGLATHTHTITNTHNHTVSYAGAVTLNADWMLVHV